MMARRGMFSTLFPTLFAIRMITFVCCPTAVVVPLRLVAAGRVQVSGPFHCGQMKVRWQVLSSNRVRYPLSILPMRIE
jgi:hypothetical protein